MTEREAFIQSIIENPGDDAPRLIFADRLEEWGEADYAEFIRLQCALATHGEYRCPKYHAGLPDILWGYPVIVDGETDHECTWCWMKKRERELLLATKPGQWSGFPEELHVGGSSARDVGLWTFRRGFVEVIRLTAEQWLRHADELTRLQPIREVELTTIPDYVIYYDASGVSRVIPTIIDRFQIDLVKHWPRIKFPMPSPPMSPDMRRALTRASEAINAAYAQRSLPIPDVVIGEIEEAIDRNPE